MTEPVDLDRAQQLADAATDGPWSWAGPFTFPGGQVPHWGLWGPRHADVLLQNKVDSERVSAADAEFIAEARQLVPALVAECRGLREQLAALEAAVVEEDVWLPKTALMVTMKRRRDENARLRVEVTQLTAAIRDALNYVGYAAQNRDTIGTGDWAGLCARLTVAVAPRVES